MMRPISLIVAVLWFVLLAACGTATRIDPEFFLKYPDGHYSLTNKDYQYEVYSNYIVIDKYIGSKLDVTVPATIDRKTVTSIGSYAFRGCSDLTSVTIPDSVTSIELQAFTGCSSLTSIIIPSSVTSIGNYAFLGCTSLTDITMSFGVTSIGNEVFAGCFSLTSIIIPSSVTSIGDWAFSECTNLTSITLPDSITSIGDEAFDECPKLTAICSNGSYAHQYCVANNVKFTLVK